MKNFFVVTLTASVLTTSGLFSALALADSSSDLVVKTIEANLNSKCMCAGTPEACCKVCPKNCKHLKSFGLMMSRENTDGPLTVTPLTSVAH